MEKNKDLYNELETSLAYGYKMIIRKMFLLGYKENSPQHTNIFYLHR